MAPTDDALPRRCRLGQNTPAELAIRRAMQAVELEGPHPRLTDAVCLLEQALGKVADYVDGKAAARPPTVVTSPVPVAGSGELWAELDGKAKDA